MTPVAPTTQKRKKRECGRVAQPEPQQVLQIMDIENAGDFALPFDPFAKNVPCFADPTDVAAGDHLDQYFVADGVERYSGEGRAPDHEVAAHADR